MPQDDEARPSSPKAGRPDHAVTPNSVRRGVADIFDKTQVSFATMVSCADHYVELAIQALDEAKRLREIAAPSAEDLAEAQGLEELALFAEQSEFDLRKQISDLTDQVTRIAQSGTYVARRFELTIEALALLQAGAAAGKVEAATLERIRKATHRLDLELADL